MIKVPGPIARLWKWFWELRSFIFYGAANLKIITKMLQSREEKWWNRPRKILTLHLRASGILTFVDLLRTYFVWCLKFWMFDISRFEPLIFWNFKSLKFWKLMNLHILKLCKFEKIKSRRRRPEIDEDLHKKTRNIEYAFSIDQQTWNEHLPTFLSSSKGIHIAAQNTDSHPCIRLGWSLKFLESPGLSTSIMRVAWVSIPATTCVRLNPISHGWRLLIRVTNVCHPDGVFLQIQHRSGITSNEKWSWDKFGIKSASLWCMGSIGAKSRIRFGLTLDKRWIDL